MNTITEITMGIVTLRIQMVMFTDSIPAKLCKADTSLFYNSFYRQKITNEYVKTKAEKRVLRLLIHNVLKCLSTQSSA